MTTTRVYLERGEQSVFAVALEWPGWCRRAKTGDLAVAELERYASRYAFVVGVTFAPGPIEVVDTVAGNRTTDFGAPSAITPWDREPWTARTLRRHVALLDDCWRSFDEATNVAPSELRRGPRGGGRSRDAIGAHVREAERAYGAKIGVRIAPRTPWPQQRSALRETLASGEDGGAWPTRYAIRRLAWHVTDHLWEMQDRSS